MSLYGFAIIFPFIFFFLPLFSISTCYVENCVILHLYVLLLPKFHVITLMIELAFGN